MDEAIVLFDRVIEINRLMDDQSALCNAFSSMGFTYHLMGNLDSAKVLYGRAMNIATERNDLNAIGDLYSSYERCTPI